MSEAPALPRTPRSHKAWLAILLLGALGLRLWDIDRRGLGHPENYVPDIPVPSWVENPPPRMDFRGILRGTLRDGHPPTYFLLMHPWEKLFGISELSLRLPSALLGTASCGLLYWFARRRNSSAIALLAALLLALQAYHIYWSDMARMYVPASFLCLISTLLLDKLHTDGRRRWHVAYIFVTAGALLTQLYCWPFVFVQIVWSTLRDFAAGREMRALRSQLAAVILGFGTVTLSLYQNPGTEWAEPEAEYLQLGNLHSATAFFWTAPPPPWVPLFLVTGVTVGLLIAGFIAHSAKVRNERVPENSISSAVANGQIPYWLIAAAAVLVTAGLECFARFAPRHERYKPNVLYAVSLMPVVIAGILPFLVTGLTHRSKRATANLRSAARLLEWPALILGLLPYVLMIGVTQVRHSYVARGTNVFLPYLMLAIAQGVGALFRVRWLGVLTVLMLVVMEVDGIRYVHAAESDPVDYRGMGAQLREALQPGDIILIRNQYKQQPLYYYAPSAISRAHFKDMSQVVEHLPAPQRVWLITMPKKPGAADPFDPDDTPDGVTSPMREAVRHLEKEGELEAQGIKAQLFVTARAAKSHQDGN